MKIEISIVSSPIPLSGSYTLLKREYFAVSEETTTETIIQTACAMLFDYLSTAEDVLKDNSFMTALQTKSVTSISDFESIVYLLQESGFDILTCLVLDEELQSPVDTEIEINILNLNHVQYGFVPLKVQKIYEIDNVKISELFKFILDSFVLFDSNITPNNPFNKLLGALEVQEEVAGFQRNSKLSDYLVSVLPRLGRAIYYCSPQQ